MELNQTMVNNSFDPGSGCLENFMKEELPQRHGLRLGAHHAE